MRVLLEPKDLRPSRINVPYREAVFTDFRKKAREAMMLAGNGTYIEDGCRTKVIQVPKETRS